jgi:sensor c-di-GMP phosphodiesterase-like protein
VTEHPWLAIVAIASAGLVAATGGYLGARHLLYAQEATRLDQAAIQVLDRSGQVLNEVHALLTNAVSSGRAFCSEGELGFLRDLVYNARYIRDIGRLRDGQLICTSTGGVLASPYITERSPDVVIDEGEEIYIGQALTTAPSQRATIVQRTQSNVVIDPQAFDNLLPRPLRYSIWIRAHTRDHLVGLWGADVSARSTALKKSGRLAVEDRLTSIACSPQGDLCAAASHDGRDIRARNFPLLLGYTLLSAVAGAGLLAALIFGLKREQKLAAQLRRAIRRNDMTLVYEPVVDLASSRMVGAEVLVRWQDEGGKPVHPEVFIALAEELGLIGGITEFVIRQAIQELAEVLRNHDFRLSINVAAADLTGSALLELLDRHVHAQQIPPARVALELTERSTADRGQIAAAIAALRAHGYPVYMDDFGAGYSSLSYLHELSVDRIKIDKSFTDALGTEAVTASVVPQILSMAASLNLGVIVEGVETSAQEASLRRLGVQFAQGWLYGKPMMAKELKARLVREKGSL